MAPAALLLLLLAAPARSQPLPPPAMAPGPALPLSARPCPPPPPPVLSLDGVRFYTDPGSTVVDPALRAEDNARSRPLADWLHAVQRPAERWVALREAGEAGCALDLMHAWARGGALLGSFNAQGGYHRKWTLAGAALTLMALREAPDPGGRRAEIGAWLAQVAREVARPYVPEPRGHVPESRANNHVAWAGLAVAAAGIASGDRALLERGMAFGARFLAGVTAEGAHPQEVARGPQALHYHLFALQPVAALARLGQGAGRPFDAAQLAALDRLTRFAFGQAADDARIVALSGAAQARPDRPWLAAAGHGFEIRPLDPAIAAALTAHRPFRHRWLGGNVTLLWGG
jgi:poly(beta-D-mannuronate) lyase